MSSVKGILRVLPAPFILWVGQWLDIFSRSNLTHPAWQIEAQYTALGVGASVAVLIGLIFRTTSQSNLRRLTKFGSVATFAFIAGCWFMWFRLGKSMPPDDVKPLQDLWELFYILAMVLLVATISVGALSLGQSKPKTVWIVAIVLALIVLAMILTGGYLLWSGS